MKALVLLLTAPLLAQAQDKLSLEQMFQQATNAPACYGREYSSDHLEKHPKQTVKQIRAKLVKDTTTPEYPSSVMELELQLQGEENFFKLFRSYLICDEKAGECYVECDGGKVKAWGSSEGTLTIENLGFLVDGGCGEEGEPKILKPQKGGDDIFQLYRLPQEFCQN